MPRRPPRRVATLLHFDLGRPLIEREVCQILRGGYKPSLGSGILTSTFFDARVSWPTPDGDRREGYKAFVKQGSEIKILGQAPLDA